MFRPQSGIAEGADAILGAVTVDSLIVNDSLTFENLSTGSLLSEGQVIIDVDSNEALLVRGDGDSGDVFAVNTNSGLITAGGSIIAQGDIILTGGGNGIALGASTSNGLLGYHVTGTFNYWSQDDSSGAAPNMVFGTESQLDSTTERSTLGATLPTDAYTHVRIMSNTAFATSTSQYIDFSHNATDGVIAVGSGFLRVNAAKAIALNSYVNTPDTTTVATYISGESSPSSGAFSFLFGGGLTTPSDAETGYLKGALFVNGTDDKMYLNQGDSSSALFKKVLTDDGGTYTSDLAFTGEDIRFGDTSAAGWRVIGSEPSATLFVNGVETIYAQKAGSTGRLRLGDPTAAGNGTWVDIYDDNRTIDFNVGSTNMMRANAKGIQHLQAIGSAWDTSTQSISAGTAISMAYGGELVTGNGGAVTITATPSLTDGFFDGQEVTILCASTTNTVTLQDESNLAGSRFKSKDGSNVVLDYDARPTVTVKWNSNAGIWFEK